MRSEGIRWSAEGDVQDRLTDVGRRASSQSASPGAGRFGFDPTSVFDPVAESYRGARPGYPEQLYERLDGLIGGIRGARVVDLGAGTGIATAALSERGASVVAVEPSLTMMGQMAFPALCARAEAIPLRSASVDLVTCAQAWHWVDPALAVPECRRVLRTGGWLALWWNVSDSGVAWLAEVEAVAGLGPYGVGRLEDAPEILTAGGAFAFVERLEIPWQWAVPTTRWLAVAATRSVFAILGDEAKPRLEAIKALLDRRFPAGGVIEPFTCRVVVAQAV